VSESKSVEYRSTFPVITILGLIFVLAKVFEIGPVADWSWWWVLAPFWVGFALVATFLVSALIFALLVAVFSK
jgi:hypothetical protein